MPITFQNSDVSCVIPFNLDQLVCACNTWHLALQGNHEVLKSYQSFFQRRFVCAHLWYTSKYKEYERKDFPTTITSLYKLIIVQ